MKWKTLLIAAAGILLVNTVLVACGSRDLSYRLKMLHFDIPFMPLLDYNDDGPHRPRAAF
jgi:hypothetical protein